MHNRMKEALVLLGRLPRAVVRPPLVKIGRAEIDRIRSALIEAGLLSSKAARRRRVTAMNNPQRPRRIHWLNVLTVISAAILISAEVFGAAFAGSWAIANLLALGTLGAHVLDGIFIALRHRGDGAVRARGAPRRAVHGELTRAAAPIHSRAELFTFA